MGRHRNHRHMLAKIEPGHVYQDGTVGSPEQIAVCGHKPWNGCTSERDKVTCPACSAKLAKTEIKARGDLAFGEPIRDPEILGYTFRSVWPLKYQGKLIGFLTMKPGWGSVWKIREIEPSARAMIGDVVGGRWDAKVYHSKEEALLAVPALVADGKLFAPEDAEAALEKARAAARREEAEKKAKRDAQDAERDRRYQVLVRAAQKCHGEERLVIDQACYALFYRHLPKEMLS